MEHHSTKRNYGDRQARAIPVRHFRQILLWPLALDHPALRDDKTEWIPAHRIVAEQAKRIDRMSGWKKVVDPLLDHIVRGPGTDRAIGPDGCATLPPPQAYEEFVYFHEFVQRFLYRSVCDTGGRKGRRSTPSAPLHLFRRDDVRFAQFDVLFGELGKLHPQSVEPKAERARVTFAVDRLNLYLFSTGVAVLAVELALDSGGAIRPLYPDGEPREGKADDLTLAHVQCLCDHLRRLHGPYWEQCQFAGHQKNLWSPRVPQRVVWLKGLNDSLAPIRFSAIGPDGKRTELSEFQPYDYSGALATIVRPVRSKVRRGVPVFSHWRTLLPLRISGYDDGEEIAATRFEGPDASYRDGRKDHPILWRNVVDERMPQLAYVSIGRAACHSHLPDADVGNILRSDWTRLCFCDVPGNGYAYDEGFLWDFEKTNCYDRFFLQGSRYLYSGYAFAAIGSGGFFDETIIHHFRRHYFQMALIAQFQLAATLTFSSWISAAVAAHESELDAREELDHFERSILAIEREIEKFTHRFLFTGVSNQMQGQEMYERWRRHLRLAELSEEVRSEISWARELLRAHIQHQQARSARQLNEIAVIVAVLALPMAFLGILRPAIDPPLSLFVHNEDWILFLLPVFALSFFGFIIALLRKWKLARAVLLGTAIISFLGLALAYLSDLPWMQKLLALWSA